MTDGTPDIPVDWSAVLRAGDEPCGKKKRGRQRKLPRPTDALPGTPEKVDVLADRQRKGLALWNPEQDAKWTPTEEVLGDGKPLAILIDVERNGAVINRHLGLQRREKRLPPAPIEENFRAEVLADIAARDATRKDEA